MGRKVNIMCLYSPSINDYYNAVSDKLRTHPNLYETKITDILASIIYEKDPASRAKLDQFRNKPDSRDTAGRPSSGK